MAPIKPGKVAAFSFNSSDTDASATAFIVAADHVTVHVVPNELALPAEVREYAIAVYPKTGVFGASIDQSSVGSLTASTRPIIFHGDLRIDVGPLVSDDRMLSELVLVNSDIKRFEMLYRASSPRGPPEPAAEQHVYVIGTVEHYNGPAEQDRSVHTAGVFDFDLLASPEQLKRYESALVQWRWTLAAQTLMGESLFANAFNDVDARKIIDAQRAEAQTGTLDSPQNYDAFRGPLSHSPDFTRKRGDPLEEWRKRMERPNREWGREPVRRPQFRPEPHFVP